MSDAKEINEIKDVKVASNLILEKIHTLALLGEDKDLKKDSEEISDYKDIHHLFSNFELSGKAFSVSKEAFIEVLTSLEKKKIIEIKRLDEEDVVGYFEDYILVCEFIAEVAKKNPDLNVRELLKNQVSFLQVLSMPRLEKEMEKFRLYAHEMNVANDESLSFDEDRSILFFRGEKIEISKNKRSDSHYLLKILFKDLTKIWAMDEIWDEWRKYDSESKDSNWHKFYNACQLINTKIAVKTKIKDFLSCSSTEIRINKEYF